MKNFAVILLMFVFSAACNGNSQNYDSDNLPDLHDYDNSDLDSAHNENNDNPDEESDIIEVADESDDFDLVKQDVDIPEDKDTQSDESNDTELPDYDYPAGKDGDPDCPSLLNAGFPYKDGDGKITFCRKCDLPAPANDPQCVRNLWEMNNRRIMEEYPETYCYPLPCDVTEKAGVTVATVVGKCDVDATGKIYQGSTGVFKQGDISDGKIGMYATASKEIDGKYIVIGSLLYDIAKKEYTMVAFADSKQAYRYNRFLFYTGNTYDKKGYIASALKVENGWKYEIAYYDPNNIEFLYPPAIGENFVIINVQKVDGTGPKEILYASVNDWKWTKLGEGLIYYPQIEGDSVFFSYNSSIWACDLTKSPANIETGCRKVSKEGEKATSPAVKKGDKNFIIYTSGPGFYQVYMADITNDETVYKKIELEVPSDLISFIPDQWEGDILVFSELYQFSQVDVDYRMCYYSISKDKKVCFPNPSPYGKTMGYIFGGVEGKYITYQPTGAIILKDMECQCKEYPDQCLYDEYMPETPVLKKK
jgi:hypothetical protein